MGCKEKSKRKPSSGYEPDPITSSPTRWLSWVGRSGVRIRRRPAIFLGDTAFARTQGIPLSSLKGWSYVQKAVGRDVIIAGRDQPSPAKSLQERRPTWDCLGTAKGVVDFLRQYAGTRFLYPDLAPYQPISAAAKIDLLSSPSIEFLKVPKFSVPADLNVTVSPRLEFNTSHPARGSFYDIANFGEVVLGGDCLRVCQQ